MTDQKKRCAIYCRVSTKDQSCERQERELLEYAERADYQIVGVFKETASGTRVSRKERQKIIDLTKKRLIDVVLVSETTRWGRSMPDLVATIQDLERRGVSLVSLSGMSFDFSTAQGKLVSSILASLAEFERDLISERVRSGLENARSKGKKLGRPKGRLKSDKYKKLRVQVRQMSGAGTSNREIAKRLNISTHTVASLLKAG